jgi:hypothetical protein
VRSTHSRDRRAAGQGAMPPAFFSEAKEAKRLLPICCRGFGGLVPRSPMSKSFLLLFFKKEHSSLDFS